MRLIDADALKKELSISGSCNNCAYESIFGCLEDIRVADVCGCIHEAPTVDAVPVVRWKECKWWKMIHIRHNVECKVCVKEAYEPIRYEDDYCSRGERRDEDDH